MRDPLLLLRLVAAGGVMLGVCWGITCCLGLRLEKTPAAVALALPWLLLSPWLFGARVLAPTPYISGVVPGMTRQAPDEYGLLNDTIHQFLPWEAEVRDSFAHGHLPLWSDRVDGGSSPWLNPQAGAASPIAMLARVVPIQFFLLAALALKVQLAFLGTWLLSRRLGRSRVASHLAAAGFCLSGGMMAWALYPHTTTLAWIPWLVLATVSLFRRPTFAAFAMAAVLTACTLLSGHPESALFGGLLAVASGISVHHRRRSLRASVCCAAGAALLGFCLAAPQMLPFAALAQHSTRAAEAKEWNQEDDRTISAGSRWFLPQNMRWLRSPFNPTQFGEPYYKPREFVNWPETLSGYAGLVALAGVAVALVSRCDRRKAPLLAYAGIAWLIAGGFVPLRRVLNAIPFVQTLAYQRCLPVFALTLALAGAFGADQLLSKRKFRLGSLCGAAVFCALSLALRLSSAVVATWVLILATPLAARSNRSVATGLLALALLLDLGPWSRAMLPSGDPDLVFPNTAVMQAWVDHAGDSALWRAVGANFIAYPSILAMYGIADIRYHNPLAPADQAEVLATAFDFHAAPGRYFSAFLHLDHPLLNFLNVRTVVASDLTPRQYGMKLIRRLTFSQSSLFLFRNPRALPRWFLPQDVQVINRGDLARWVGSMQDAERVAVFRDEAGSGLAGSSGAERGEVHSLAVRPGHIVLDLGRPDARERLLATSLPHPFSWQATAKGESLKTVTVNGAFLGIRVPAGVSEVRLDFWPPGFTLGLALFTLAAISLVFTAWISHSQTGRPQHSRTLVRRGRAG